MNYKSMATRSACQTQLVLVVVPQLSEQKRIAINLVDHTVFFIDAA